MQILDDQSVLRGVKVTILCVSENMKRKDTVTDTDTQANWLNNHIVTCRCRPIVVELEEFDMFIFLIYEYKSWIDLHSEL